MTDYIIHLLILFSIYAILGISLNLVVGYTGLLSVAHAAFYGIGAYATAILTTTFNVSFFPSLAAGIIIASLTSFLIGMVLNKFNGDYYALASFGFNIIVFSFFLNWENLTRGTLGIPGIPRPALSGASFHSNLSFLLIALFFLSAIYLISLYLTGSSFGRTLKAIRENEKIVQLFGFNTLHYKLAIFVISAAMASIAGSLFASYLSFIDPSSFSLQESIFILTIIIFGGLANLKGSIVGALFLILFPEALRFVGFPDPVAAQTRQIVYGIVLVMLMLYRPQGLIGEYKL